MGKTNYLEPAALKDVAEFHETFRHPILAEPGIPAPERAELRIELIREELDELRKAFEKGSRVDVMDALCDLQYVLSGTVLECGMGRAFAAAFAEVHRSNMSKACATKKEAIETVEHYADNGSESCAAHYKESGGQFLVYRTSDNKTLKSINYSKAMLGRLVLPVRKREAAN